MNKPTTPIFPTITFPSQKEADEFDQQSEEKGWYTIYTGPSINLEKLKRKLTK